MTLVSCVSAQNASPSTTEVTPNGYIRAENGTFSLTGNTLCSYSSGPNANEAYVRQCYVLSSGEWKSTGAPEKTNAQPVNDLDFSPCDPLNQLSVAAQHAEIAALLPRSAALKQVIEMENAAVAVYSDSPHETVRYELRLAFLVRRNGKWIRATDISVSADGNFCGMRLMDRKNGAVVLVYIDEVAGSADYSAIRSFRLSWPR
jgi:hypothetical protein